MLSENELTKKNPKKQWYSIWKKNRYIKIKDCVYVQFRHPPRPAKRKKKWLFYKIAFSLNAVSEATACLDQEVLTHVDHHIDGLFNESLVLYGRWLISSLSDDASDALVQSFQIRRVMRSRVKRDIVNKLLGNVGHLEAYKNTHDHTQSLTTVSSISM